MKNLLFGFLFLITACKKDTTFQNSIVGKWTYSESEYGTGFGFQTFKPDPAHPVSITFKSNGEFTLDTQYVYTAFQDQLMPFNRYRLYADTLIFYSNERNEEFKVIMELDQKLSLHTLGCREGCTDTFQRKF